jgi:hypothetical protein
MTPFRPLCGARQISPVSPGHDIGAGFQHKYVPAAAFFASHHNSDTRLRRAISCRGKVKYSIVNSGSLAVGGNAMRKNRIKTTMFALATTCVLSVLLPTESFAALINIACDAVWRNCLGNCGATGNKQACTDRCDTRRDDCVIGDTPPKQQTPPPPCTGIHCTLRNPHPPTSVGPPTRKPRPVKPVKPVGVSNPNKTNTGNSGPVILYRKNGSDGAQGKGH